MITTSKKQLALLLALAVLFSLPACSSKPNEPAASPGDPSSVSGAATFDAEEAIETQPLRSFTDSVGRTVELPNQIDQIAVSGPLAQIVLFALCPDKLVGVADAWSADAEAYLDTKYYHMPVIGQLYGGKGELNLETLLSSGAQVVIDVGEPKGSLPEDLDALQEQTGIPFVHITARTNTMGDAYRMLGELLNMPDEAEVLAAYCDSTLARINQITQSVEKVKLLYLTGNKGLNVIANGSYHAEVIDMLADNLAVVDEPSSKGTGNEVDAEQLLNWNPDVILVAPGSIYTEIGKDPLLQNISAIQNGAYYEVPQGPYNWMGFPPSVQRLLGMLWMVKLLYPDAADYDLCEEVTTYYRLFYHCELTAEQYQALVANSIGKQSSLVAQR